MGGWEGAGMGGKLGKGVGDRSCLRMAEWEDFLHRVTLTKWEDSRWWRCFGISKGGVSDDWGLGEWYTHYLFRIRIL